MPYINTLTVTAESTAAATAAAIAQALASALGWEYDSATLTVWDDTSHTLGIKIYASSATSIGCYGCTASSSYSVVSINYNTNATICVDYITSVDGYTTAIGLRLSTSNIVLQMCLSEDANGATTLMVVGSGIYCAYRTDTAFWMYYLIANAGASTSLIKLPSIHNACMYRDLYDVMSSDYLAYTDLVINIAGHYYRFVGSNTASGSVKLAIPVG